MPRLRLILIGQTYRLEVIYPMQDDNVTSLNETDDMPTSYCTAPPRRSRARKGRRVDV
jgi:hypothetical protein